MRARRGLGAGLRTVVGAAVLVIASGCSGDSVTQVCGPEPEGSPTELATSAFDARRVIGDASEDEFNVVIDVANIQEAAAELHLEINGQAAVVVRVPGQAAECHTTPIYRYGLTVPNGQALIQASTDSGHSDEMTIDVSESTRWVVVQLQAEFPLELEAFDHRPGWG